MTLGWGRSRTLLCAGAVFCLLAPVTAVCGQATNAPPPSPPNPSPAASPPREPQPGQDDIVVTAPAQQSSIDRQTYLVRDTAEARSATVPDILQRIPSVEVQADGSVRLVGAGTATILIDGRRVSDPQTILRNLQGSQIERVEVLTNPGAQFSAQGTGGIINIITRRNAQNGLGGSATATGGNFDSYDLRVSPTYGVGNWTFTGNAGHGGGENHTRFERERYSLTPGGPVLESGEAGRQDDRYRYYYANGSASYRPSDRHMFTLSGTAAHNDITLTRPSVLTSAAVAGGSADQLALTDIDFDFRQLGFDYRGTTARQGETITASLQWTDFHGQPERSFLTDPAAGPPILFQQQRDNREQNWTAKADYVRPLGGDRRLSIGVQFVDTDTRIFQAATGTLPSGAPFAATSTVDGAWFEYAGYATFQFGVAGFTILPGLRLEGRSYELGGTTGAPDLKSTNFFPSLHVERPLAAWLTGSASYSRRITYPVIQQLNPALDFFDPTTAQGGNPLLRPQFGDSYEARLRANLARHNFELTAFRRETEDIFSNRGELNADGVLVIRPFNFGAQALTGAELSARGPIVAGLRYVLTANVSDQALDQDSGGPLPVRHAFQYAGTAQLEYRDGQDGRRGSDRMNLTLRYFGPVDTGFTRSSASAFASLSWTHAFTDRLSTVLNVQQLRLTDPQLTVTTGATSQSRDLRDQSHPRVTLSLTWSFRAPGQGPQVRQQQPAGPPPIPTP